MKVTVVLTTYNGIQYLEEQLNSLRNQTRKADEVLIYDDCSSDGTYEFAKLYIDKYNLSDTWNLTENETNLGWQNNFFYGIKKAQGDYIFPCDQDDIWHPDKISAMTEVMENHSKIQVLEGVAHKFSEHVTYNNITLLQKMRIGIGNWLDNLFHSHGRYKGLTNCITKGNINRRFMIKAPGCALCFRKDFFNKIENQWFDKMPHDALLTYYGKLLDGYYLYDHSVIEWRQHIGSASRPKERKKDLRVRQITEDHEILKRLQSYLVDHIIDTNKNVLISRLIKWNALRIRLVCDHQWFAGFALIRYVPYYTQYRRFLTDWLYAFS